MARLSAAAWAAARADYEARGLSFVDIARRFGIAASSVSRRAKAGGWTQTHEQTQQLINKKLSIIRQLEELETQTQQLSLQTQQAIDEEVKARLEGGSSPGSSRLRKLKLDGMIAGIRDSRAKVEAAMRDLSPADSKNHKFENNFARLNIQLLQDAVLALQSAGELDVKQVGELARAVKSLVQAESADAALTAKLREEGRRAAERKLEAALENAADEVKDSSLTPLQVMERIKVIYRSDGHA